MARRVYEEPRKDDQGALLIPANQASLLPPLSGPDDRPSQIADIKQRILESRLKRQ
jgi:hypothetical protein